MACKGVPRRVGLHCHGPLERGWTPNDGANATRAGLQQAPQPLERQAHRAAAVARAAGRRGALATGALRAVRRRRAPRARLRPRDEARGRGRGAAARPGAPGEGGRRPRRCGRRGGRRRPRVGALRAGDAAARRLLVVVRTGRLRRGEDRVDLLLVPVPARPARRGRRLRRPGRRHARGAVVVIRRARAVGPRAAPGRRPAELLLRRRPLLRGVRGVPPLDRLHAPVAALALPRGASAASDLAFSLASMASTRRRVASTPSHVRVSRRRSTQSKRRQRTGEPAFKPCAQGGCSPKTMQLRYPDGLAMGGVRERHSQNCRSELEALGWWTRGADGNPCVLGDFVSA